MTVIVNFVFFIDFVNVIDLDQNDFGILGLGATLNVAKPKKGSSVAVFGLGAVGLAVSYFILQLFKHVPYIFTLNYVNDLFVIRLLKVLELLVHQGSSVLISMPTGLNLVSCNTKLKIYQVKAFNEN